MPSYDFKCLDCDRPILLVYPSFEAYDEALEHVCPVCGGINTKRLIGRVAVSKGELGRTDRFADEMLTYQFDEKDPEAMGRFMRKMTNDLGSEMTNMGEPFDEAVDQIERGRPTAEIEPRSIQPDLGGGDAAE